MKKNAEKGFTIVELVIVIAVIAILAAVLIPSFSNVIKKAEESAYMQEKQLQEIADSLEKLENKDYLTWEELENKISEKMMDSSEIEQIVRDVAEEYARAKKDGDTGLTEDQVCKIIDKMLDGKLTESEIKNIVDERISADSNETEDDETVGDDVNKPVIPSDAVAVSGFDEFVSAVRDLSADYIVLNSNIVLEETVVLDRDITVDLSGNRVSMSDMNNNTQMNMFEIFAGADVVIKNGDVSFYAKGSYDTEDDLFFVQSGTLQNRSALTLDGVNVYVESSGREEIVSAVFVNSYTDITFEGSNFVVPHIETENFSSVSHYAQNYVICINRGSVNSKIVMNGGRAEMLGNGYMSFIKSYFTANKGSEYISNVSVSVNNAVISVDNIGNRATGNVIVFDINNTVSSIKTDNSKITLDGANDYATSSFGAYLVRRKNGFNGEISFFNTDITLDNLNKNNMVETADSVVGGSVLLQGGNCDERVGAWLEGIKQS